MKGRYPYSLRADGSLVDYCCSWRKWPWIVTIICLNRLMKEFKAIRGWIGP